MQDGSGNPHYEAPDNLQAGYVECVWLTFSYPLFFLCFSNVSRMLHCGSVGWFHSNEWYLNSVHPPLSPHWKIWLLGMLKKKQYRGGITWKGGLGKFVDLKGGVVRKRGWCFWGVIDAPMHTMLYVYVYIVNIFFLFFINKNVFFSFLFLFCNEISNICNRILTNQKPE